MGINVVCLLGRIRFWAGGAEGAGAERTGAVGAGEIPVRAGQEP